MSCFKCKNDDSEKVKELRLKIENQQDFNKKNIVNKGWYPNFSFFFFSVGQQSSEET